MPDKFTYIEQYKVLYSNDDSYKRPAVYLEEASLFIDYLKPATVLDYGCGSGALADALAEKYPEIQVYGYDPAVEGRDILPVTTADLVFNNDVLEHIPEELLDPVLSQIAAISLKVVFGLHHALASAILPNGENAHCTVKPPDWYKQLLSKHFPCVVPLAGRKTYLSMAVTFPISQEIIQEYNTLLDR
jgi:trans-aconitate methyltransferase